MAPKIRWYAVAVGRSPGIYQTWADCRAQVHGYSKAVYMSFSTRPEAEAFLERQASSSMPETQPQIDPTPDSNDETVVKAESKAPHDGDASEHEKSANASAPSGNQTTDVSTVTTVQENSTTTVITTTTTTTTKKSLSCGDTKESATVPEKSAPTVAAASTQQQPPPLKKRKTKTALAQKHLHIHIAFDGGSRGNPGRAGAGAIVTLTEQSKDLSTPYWRKVIKIRDYLGQPHTNNQAEYRGIVSALRATLHQVHLYHQLQRQQGNVQSGKGGDGKEISNASQVSETVDAGNGATTKAVSADVYLRIELVVQGDSHLILQQLCGVWECKNAKLKPYHEKAVRYLQQLGDWGECQRSLQHIYRHLNKEADGTLSVVRGLVSLWAAVFPCTPLIRSLLWMRGFLHGCVLHS
jgi:Caulimovirus viroplasmin